jgi:hypothetical protein
MGNPQRQTPATLEALDHIPSVNPGDFWQFAHCEHFAPIDPSTKYHQIPLPEDCPILDLGRLQV